MKVDSTVTKEISQTVADVGRIVRTGYDGAWVGETKHEPFLQCIEIARAAPGLTLGTSIAIAFARSPMTLAGAAYDLAAYTEGRFVLGLGSQVKPHIERRFSMPWSEPARRMRELILATRAIWSTWHDGAKLDFRGDFYSHTLMTPFFSPAPHPYGPPPIYLAGVGELMTEVAGEVADGFFVHPFTTRRYLDEVTLPALRRGRLKAGQPDLDGFTVAGQSFVVAGRTEEELAVATAGAKDQIAFYASTPAYRTVLELHGFGDLQPELTALSKADRWKEMGPLIPDELLAEIAVIGTPEECGQALVTKLGDVQQRVTVYATYSSPEDLWPPLIEAVHGSSLSA